MSFARAKIRRFNDPPADASGGSSVTEMIVTSALTNTFASGVKKASSLDCLNIQPRATIYTARNPSHSLFKGVKLPSAVNVSDIAIKPAKGSSSADFVLQAKQHRAETVAASQIQLYKNECTKLKLQLEQTTITVDLMKKKMSVLESANAEYLKQFEVFRQEITQTKADLKESESSLLQEEHDNKIKDLAIASLNQRRRDLSVDISQMKSNRRNRAAKVVDVPVHSPGFKTHEKVRCVESAGSISVKNDAQISNETDNTAQAHSVTCSKEDALTEQQDSKTGGLTQTERNAAPLQVKGYIAQLESNAASSRFSTFHNKIECMFEKTVLRQTIEDMTTEITGRERFIGYQHHKHRQEMSIMQGLNQTLQGKIDLLMLNQQTSKTNVECRSEKQESLLNKIIHQIQDKANDEKQSLLVKVDQLQQVTRYMTMTNIRDAELRNELKKQTQRTHDQLCSKVAQSETKINAMSRELSEAVYHKKLLQDKQRACVTQLNDVKSQLEEEIKSSSVLHKQLIAKTSDESLGSGRDAVKRMLSNLHSKVRALRVENDKKCAEVTSITSSMEALRIELKQKTEENEDLRRAESIKCKRLRRQVETNTKKFNEMVKIKDEQLELNREALAGVIDSYKEKKITYDLLKNEQATQIAALQQTITEMKAKYVKDSNAELCDEQATQIAALQQTITDMEANYEKDSNAELCDEYRAQIDALYNTLDDMNEKFKTHCEQENKELKARVFEWRILSLHIHVLTLEVSHQLVKCVSQWKLLSSPTDEHCSDLLEMLACFNNMYSMVIKTNSYCGREEPSQPLAESCVKSDPIVAHVLHPTIGSTKRSTFVAIARRLAAAARRSAGPRAPNACGTGPRTPPGFQARPFNNRVPRLPKFAGPRTPEDPIPWTTISPPPTPPVAGSWTPPVAGSWTPPVAGSWNPPVAGSWAILTDDICQTIVDNARAALKANARLTIDINALKAGVAASPADADASPADVDASPADVDASTADVDAPTADATAQTPGAADQTPDAKALLTPARKGNSAAARRRMRAAAKKARSLVDSDQAFDV